MVQLMSHGFAPRWKRIGAATLAPPWWGKDISAMLPVGDKGHSVACKSASAPCGVSQGSYFGGYNAGQSFGSAIMLQGTKQYSLRLVVRGSASTHLRVKLEDGRGKQIYDSAVQLTPDWATVTQKFVSGVTTTNATLTIMSTGVAEWGLGTLSLNQVENTWRGMRKDVVAALRTNGFKGILRYPGGCFSSFYRWKISLLHPDKQPPVGTPPGFCTAVAGGVSAYTDGFMSNGIGIDNYIALCEEVGMIPGITVRMNWATSAEIQEAADWVEYMNGNTSTRWGRERAKRGHPAPYNVTYWYVGNEMIDQWWWYRGYPNDWTATERVPAHTYASSAKAAAEAMMGRSPFLPLRLVAVSGHTFNGGWEWDQQWGKSIGRHIYAASFHKGYMWIDKPSKQAHWWSKKGATEIAKRTKYKFVPMLRDMRKELNGNVGISTDEWGLGPPWAVKKFAVSHAIYAATFLGTMTRLAPELNITLTNYFEPINEGAFTVNPFSVSQTPLGQVMKVYSDHQLGARLRVKVDDDDLDVLATVHCGRGTDELVMTVVHLNAEDWHPRDLVVAFKSWAPALPANVTTLRAQGVSDTSVFDTLHKTVEIGATNHELKLVVPPYSVVHVRVGLGAWCAKTSASKSRRLMLDTAQRVDDVQADMASSSAMGAVDIRSDMPSDLGIRSGMASGLGIRSDMASGSAWFVHRDWVGVSLGGLVVLVATQITLMKFGCCRWKS